jgi:hypothetical protein
MVKEKEAKAAEARQQEQKRQREAAESGAERRRAAGKDDAQRAFRTLLAEVVKDPTKTWADVKVLPFFVSPAAHKTIGMCVRRHSVSNRLMLFRRLRIGGERSRLHVQECSCVGSSVRM